VSEGWGSRVAETHPVARAYIRPYDYVHDRYSAYYRTGLRRWMAATGGRYDEISMGRQPEVLRAIRRVRDAYSLRPFFQRLPWLLPAIDHAAQRIEGPVHFPARVFVDSASCYLVRTTRGRVVKVCVDADDHGASLDERMLAWSDVYLKTNYWPTLSYASKVQPFVNADPLVIPQLDVFRAYRSLPKEYDISMVVRVWGGKDEIEGVEHNLRLLEAVSRARCSKFLYAYLVAGDIPAATRRLERQGIPCGTDPLPPRKLWRVSAASRLNVIRLGMHHCIPWRVTGALAIGSAIVLDRAPLTRWPQPLVDGDNYVALGTVTGVDHPLATDAQYAAIPAAVEAWLADGALAGHIARNNAAYYDRFVDPERVGEQIIAAAERYEGSGRTPETTRSSPA
jgi:hypothetical protein